jgi:hypothetical protein
MPNFTAENQQSQSDENSDGPDAAVPDVLTHDGVEHCFERLREEWAPTTPTEVFFVREMARHEAALERAEQIEVAILRRGSRGALRLPVDLGSRDAHSDAALAGAGITDALERISEYRRTHERGYYKGLAMLNQTRASPPGNDRIQDHNDAKAAFQTESACETHLIENVWSCAGCGSTQCRWIRSRKVCACRECRRESSLRAGTVAARSPLPLRIWFQGIAALLDAPNASTNELAAATGIRRPGTLRRMASRIRAAIASRDASKQLMGLDIVFGPARTGDGHSRKCPKK